MSVAFKDHMPTPEGWGTPDMSVLHNGRRAAPAFPLDVLGEAWAVWVETAAEAAAAPADYVALPLLASASALIGNARWVEAAPGWTEPPHLWCGVVGDSGSSKSPGADCLLRDVLPVIEDRMCAGFTDILERWQAEAQLYKAKRERWEQDVKVAEKSGHAPPMPPLGQPEEPQMPRLLQSDVTIEKVAALLATAAPKGLLVVRDEVAGWVNGMTVYNSAGRQFWLETHGGRPHRVERKLSPKPITVPRLTVAVTGGTQPEKLAEMFREADDGLLARFLWAWPEARPFRLGHRGPDAVFAIDALDRLRRLEMTPATSEAPSAPILVPVAASARPMLEAFGQDMQRMQSNAGGLLRSAYGKARGYVVRLALVLEFLRWTSTDIETAPQIITEAALAAACHMVADYFMPMATRVYGDAATPQAERNAATLARWINQTKPCEVHVRHLQREVRLPGLRTADTIRAACDALVDADWLRSPPPGAFQARAKVAYAVNPAIVQGRVP